MKVDCIFIVFKPKCETIGNNTKNNVENSSGPAPGTPENSFLKIYVMCPIGWHLFGIAHVKVHVFPVLKIYVKLKLEELVLNYVFCTM